MTDDAEHETRPETRTKVVSIDELLREKKAADQFALAKPQFLSKKKRDDLKAQKVQKQGADRRQPVKRRQVRYDDDGGDEDAASSMTGSSHVPISESRGRPAAQGKPNKFKFEWDSTDDTSNGGSGFLIQRRQNSSQSPTAIPVPKMQHWSQKPLSAMNDRDWRIVKEDFQITFKNGSLMNPLRSWQESAIPNEILDFVTQTLKFAHPTPIQRATIPTALTHRDVVGIAETGSGKTLAFIIPVLVHLMGMSAKRNLAQNTGPYVLVLAPTRELALQIEREFSVFSKVIRFRSCAIIGGHSFEEILYNLQNGVDVVVATPGRLLDCIERHMVSLSQCRYLVMDEADRMINMGFEPQVTNILQNLPDKLERNTMMFTATMPPEIGKLTEKYLNRPGVVTVGELGLSAVESVHQIVEIVRDENAKMSRLLKILLEDTFKPPIIVFVNYKRTGQDIYTKLSKEGYRATLMHGSKSQDQREEAIAKVKNHELDILIATDVAGRGIDISDVSLVVNYQMSTKIEEYTHRIGRTGRAGKEGTAITFIVEEQDIEVLPDLQKLVSKQKWRHQENNAFLHKNFSTRSVKILD